MSTLSAQGYRVIGPVLRDGAILFDDLDNADDLPWGWGDSQAPGAYRVQRREDGAAFGYAVGPHAWKKILHPPEKCLWSARRTGDGLAFEDPPAPEERIAFLGVRACDLAAIGKLDRVFQGPPVPDPDYAARRQGVLIIAVNCGTPSGTCFCASMGTGPAVQSGYDLALTELIGADRHVFLAEAGSPAGEALLAACDTAEETDRDRAVAAAVLDGARARMGRHLQTDGLAERLKDRPEHPRWEAVTARCLTCANCTMVCPTCFCSTAEDRTDLEGAAAERWQRWDSCFNLDFSHTAGGAVRASEKSRYRQWLTHKLATWHDQFGESGCVGCGRCITWCPVGIDITEEAAAIAFGPEQGKAEGAT